MNNNFFHFVFSAYRKCQSDDIHCGSPADGTAITGRIADPCVPKDKKCDGYLDCRTGRDEEGCTGVSCRLDQFRCANGLRCIDAALKCNHKNDCGDNTDELGCSKSRHLITNNFYRFTFRASNHHDCVLIVLFLSRFPAVSWWAVPLFKCLMYTSQFPL